MPRTEPFDEDGGDRESGRRDPRPQVPITLLSSSTGMAVLAGPGLSTLVGDRNSMSR